MLTRNKTMALVTLLMLLVAAYYFLERKALPATLQTAAIGIPAKIEKPEIRWKPPSESDIPAGTEGDLIRYGKDLIVHTSKYFGPKGSIAAITNGMNCQNCHLDAGRKIFGYNFSGTSANFPRHDDRSGGVKTLAGRVTDCFERSLNGKSIDSNSREMKAFIAYINWIGQYAAKNEKPAGSGTQPLKFLDRPADTLAGHQIFLQECTKCHGLNGEGKLTDDKTGFLYPPLWGENSYNTGAGLGRLIRLSGFVKANMPFGTRYDSAYLSDEQAWDVAAYVNSKSRPQKDLRQDWPDIEKKPIDLPYGPYADSFSTAQHQLGPYGPIKKIYDARLKSK